VSIGHLTTSEARAKLWVSQLIQLRKLYWLGYDEVEHAKVQRALLVLTEEFYDVRVID